MQPRSIFALLVLMFGCEAGPDPAPVTLALNPQSTLEADHWAFAYNHQAAAETNTTYDAHPEVSRNSTGAVDRVTRLATGQYRVDLSFPGVGGPFGGNVLVTAVGGDNRRCNVDHWGNAGFGVEVFVNCFAGMPSAARANSQFLVAYQFRGTLLVAATTGYAWNDDQGTGEASPPYSYNSVGGVNRIIKNPGGLVGYYQVKFGRLFSPTNGGNAQVTATGSSGHCKAADWEPVDSDMQVHVICFAADGSPANSTFTVSYSDFSPLGTPSAGYVWHQALGEERHSPDPHYRRTHIGTSVLANQIFTGIVDVGTAHMYISYNRDPEGGPLSLPGGAPMITAFGWGPEYCKTVGWNGGGVNGQLFVHVNCFGRDGARKRNHFSAVYGTDQR
jgi:hypothetical protein